MNWLWTQGWIPVSMITGIITAPRHHCRFHLAHILPPRHFLHSKRLSKQKNPDLKISAMNPAETLPAKRIHSQTIKNIAKSPTSQPLLNPPHPQDFQPSAVDDRASPKSRQHLDLGKVMIKNLVILTNLWGNPSINLGIRNVKSNNYPWLI